MTQQQYIINRKVNIAEFDAAFAQFREDQKHH